MIEPRKSKYFLKNSKTSAYLFKKMAKKSYFKKATSNSVMDNQGFWKLDKPFLSNKGGLEGSDISFVKEGEIITNNQTFATIFNDHYINIFSKI